MNRPTRRAAIQSGLLGFGSLSIGTPALLAGGQLIPTPFSFHYDHILGTSLDVWLLVKDVSAAEVCERAILDEIERLRLVFSTFDPSSEINWLNRSNGPLPISTDMRTVLREYEHWQAQTNGALNAQLGELVRIWKTADMTGVAPDPTTLAHIARQANQPGWIIEEQQGALTRLTTLPLNLNAIAKGYIIDRAAAVVARVPSLRGLLLNLGGDLRAWSGDGWIIGVQDPQHPEDNGRPLAALRVQNSAVATSGGYLRYYAIGGQRFSHLFDPSTGRSADGAASATVVAPNNVTANALATALCILPPVQGLRLIADTPGAECLLVTADGRQLRSPGLPDLELPLEKSAVVLRTAEAEEAWPKEYQVTISVTLPKINAPRYRRPYVAIWVENAAGKPVRSLQVWGAEPKYLSDLPLWWKFAQRNVKLVNAVTRATRAGQYDVVWDGKDDQGAAVAQGTYTIKVEVHREHGKHLTQTGKIACGASEAKVTLAKNEETEATTVEYGKKK